jgi:hypothetical protein
VAKAVILGLEHAISAAVYKALFTVLRIHSMTNLIKSPATRQRMDELSFLL